MDSFKTLSIIIPAYNEAKTIHLILDRVYAVNLIHGLQKEVILVNDSSTDNTEEVLLNYRATHPEMNMQYYKHEINQGKGAAIHTGIKKATGEFLVIQDADLEYDPEEFNKLLSRLSRIC
jgi:glycosyltransferase involved in cell wall biosynthesis